jgi:hypothetical protein
MNARRPSARTISRITTHIAGILLAGVVASCAQAPTPHGQMAAGACPAVQPCPACPACPPAKPAPETARYLESTFDALPGWSAAALEPSLRAFLGGCPRGGARAAACTAARAVPAGDEAAARRFFEQTFVP